MISALEVGVSLLALLETVAGLSVEMLCEQDNQDPFLNLTRLKCWKANLSRTEKVDALLSILLLKFSSEFRFGKMLAEKI